MRIASAITGGDLLKILDISGLFQLLPSVQGDRASPGTAGFLALDDDSAREAARFLAALGQGAKPDETVFERSINGMSGASRFAGRSRKFFPAPFICSANVPLDI